MTIIFSCFHTFDLSKYYFDFQNANTRYWCTKWVWYTWSVNFFTEDRRGSMTLWTFIYLSFYRTKIAPVVPDWRILSQPIRGIVPMLYWCWASVGDGGSTSIQHWVNVSWLLGLDLLTLREGQITLPEYCRPGYLTLMSDVNIWHVTYYSTEIWVKTAMWFWRLKTAPPPPPALKGLKR